MSNKFLPVVSVIVPNYNKEKYIKESLESALSQDYTHYQVVIVDDGSTDNSWNIIDSFITKKRKTKDNVVYGTYDNDIGIIAIRQEKNSNQSVARNIAIKMLWNNSDAFALLDSDDIYTKDKLSRCVEVWKEAPQHIGLIYHDYIVNDHVHNISYRRYTPTFDKQRLEQENYIYSNAFISKTALGKAGMFIEQFAPLEDWDMWLRITDTFIAIQIPEVLGTYNIYGANSSLTVDENKKQAIYREIMRQVQLRKMGQQ